jgi:hypothetical protein
VAVLEAVAGDSGFSAPSRIRRDCGRFGGVWAADRGCCPNDFRWRFGCIGGESSSKLDAVAAQPDVRTLDQLRERLAQPLDGGADLLGVYVWGRVLKASLKNVELVQ